MVCFGKKNIYWKFFLFSYFFYLRRFVSNWLHLHAPNLISSSDGKFERFWFGHGVSWSTKIFTPSFLTHKNYPWQILYRNSKIFFPKRTNLAKKNFRFKKKALVGFIVFSRGIRICNQIFGRMFDAAGILLTDRQTDRQTWVS